MKKKWLALALTVAMVLGSLTACGTDASKDDKGAASGSDAQKTVEQVADGGGKVLNIYVWNTEFKDRFEKYYKDYDKDSKSIGDVKVNFVTNTNGG